MEGGKNRWRELEKEGSSVEGRGGCKGRVSCARGDENDKRRGLKKLEKRGVSGMGVICGRVGDEVPLYSGERRAWNREGRSYWDGSLLVIHDIYYGWDGAVRVMNDLHGLG